MRKKKTLALMMAATMLFTACSANESADEKAADTTINEKTESTAAQTEEFVFTRDNFPELDGSTSLAPLGEAVASVLLGEEREAVSDLVQFNKTTQSYRNLLHSQCDLIFASEPDPEVFDEMKEANFQYDIEPISTEALIFVVNKNNPVDSLTTEQIQKIYSGEITNWKEVGGEDLEIEAFQRNEGSGSQALMEKLVMKDIPMMEAPVDFVVSTMSGLMESVREYDNNSSAIGYSVYYYATEMKMADGLKIIKIDGVNPEPATIREGTYPHTNAYYCAISARAASGSPERILYDWIVSEEGQKLVAEEGYVSILDVEEDN